MVRPGQDIEWNDGIAATMAAAIHETWRALAQAEGWRMQPHLDQDYALLTPEDQADNLAAARRMPAILAMAGLTIGKQPDGLTADAVTSRIEAAIETMAEAEHDGWMLQKQQAGWEWASERDDARKRHPSMIPYARLSDREKNKDRNSVRHYPDFAARAGLHIVAGT